jgi:phosphoglycerol transferase MdoB-like AlkP superfamily enzyme
LVSNISKTKTYKDFTVDGNRFVTGIEGRLHYNTKSFEEALLFTKIGDTTILHSLLFLIIGLILFFSIQRINDAKMFSQKMVNILFGLMMLLYVFPLLIHYFERQIVGKMLLKKTGNMFELVMTQDLGTEKFLILSVLLMFIYFIKKGTEIQEEQDLTV